MDKEVTEFQSPWFADLSDKVEQLEIKLRKFKENSDNIIK